MWEDMAKGWERLGSVDEFPEGVLTPVQLCELKVVVCNLGGDLLALADQCPGNDCRLSDGVLNGEFISVGDRVRCNVRDGSCAGGAADVRTFSLMTVDEEVFVLSAGEDR